METQGSACLNSSWYDLEAADSFEIILPLLYCLV